MLHAVHHRLEGGAAPRAFAFLFVATVCAGAPVTSGAANEPSGEAWAVKEVETCGVTLLSLPSDTTETSTWTAYGERIDTYLGVDAYSNGTRVRAACFQCTEVAHRFIRRAYGIESFFCGPDPMGNARFVVRNLGRKLGDRIGSTARLGPYRVQLVTGFSGESRCRPTVGSIVSVETSGKVRACDWATGTGGGCDDWTPAKAYDPKLGAGHIAVIRRLEETEPGRLEGTLFAQHGKMYSGRRKHQGRPFAFGRVRFERRDGRWFGWWRTPTPNGGVRTRARPVIAWASAKVVGRDATPASWVELSVETPCRGLDPKLSFGATCRRIRRGR